MRKILVVVLFFFMVNILNAQCAMCRAQLESMEDNTVAEGINDGIVYLMVVPYVLLALVGYFVYKSFKKKNS